MVAVSCLSLFAIWDGHISELPTGRYPSLSPTLPTSLSPISPPRAARTTTPRRPLRPAAPPSLCPHHCSLPPAPSPPTIAGLLAAPNPTQPSRRRPDDPSPSFHGRGSTPEAQEEVRSVIPRSGNPSRPAMVTDGGGEEGGGAAEAPPRRPASAGRQHQERRGSSPIPLPPATGRRMRTGTHLLSVGKGPEPPAAVALDLPSPTVTTATMDLIWYDKGFIVPGSSASCFCAMAAALVLFGIGYKNSNECGGS